MRFMLRGPLDRGEAKRRIERFERQRRERGLGHWAVEAREDTTLVGGIGLLHHHDWPEDPDNVEVGWLLDPREWGRGLATEGAIASLGYGFESLGLERIISIAHPENLASRRVMEKAGLVPRGSRTWRGGAVVWYAADQTSWLRPRGERPRPEPVSLTRDWSTGRSWCDGANRRPASRTSSGTPRAAAGIRTPPTLAVSRKTGSVMRAGDGGLTGILCR